MAAPAIGRRRRWAPPISAKVDRSHPLAGGLLACHLPTPAGAKDLTGGPTLPRIGAPTIRPTALGMGLASPTANDGCSFVTGTSGRFSIQPPLTLLAVVQYSAPLTEYHDFYGVGYDNIASDPYIAYELGYNLGYGGVVTIWGNSAGTLSDACGAAPPAPGTHVFAGTFAPGGSTLYIDGVLAASTSGVTTINYSSQSSMGFGYQGSVGSTRTAATAFGAVWTRALSAPEIARLSADPFQFLRF